MPPPTALAGLPVSRKGDKSNPSGSLAITQARSEGVTRIPTGESSNPPRNPTGESSTPTEESSNPPGNQAIRLATGHVYGSDVGQSAPVIRTYGWHKQGGNVCRRWTTACPHEAGAQDSSLGVRRYGRATPSVTITKQ